MKSTLRLLLLIAVLGVCWCAPRSALAESQGNDYKGITDPFGDPTNYEFAEDEKEDKEFFHLGRYLMLGVDTGLAIFTGGLGRSVNPGFFVGLKLQYFFDRQICLELAGHYSNHLDQLRPDANNGADIDTNMIPITMGFRFYFDTRNAPKAIAIANPYLAAGGGVYLRSLSVIQSQGNIQLPTTSSTSFGAYGGGGVEFSVYHRHIYLGIDLRYHYIFFPDADSTFGGSLQSGDRSGQYFTSALSISYNF
jgi:hypothetical protein